MKCDYIRSCGAGLQGLLNQISGSSDVDTRVQLGNQFTAQLVQCLNSKGISCEQVAADQVDFGNGIVYDVIENLKGTKGPTAKISCHHVSEGTGGGGGDIDTGGSGGGGGNGGGNGFDEYLPYIAAGLGVLVIIKMFKS